MLMILLAGVAAFLLWVMTDTGLKHEHVEDAAGYVSVPRLLLIVILQILLWCAVFALTGHLYSRLPAYFVSGWRRLLTGFGALFIQWFAFLMVLQYAWSLFTATFKTAIYAVSMKTDDWKIQRALNREDQKLRNIAF
jgi:hypothetical protein